MNMVEKVARALCFEEGRMGDTQSIEMQRVERDWKIHVPSARAAIEAMRDPTELMVSEGESASSLGIGRPSDDEALPRVWHWMIDAALGDK